MIQNIIAIEYDGKEMRAISISCEVPSSDFDLASAIKKAATDFCRTEEGMAIYDYNCSFFNWADFEVSVPNSFCEKYGFKKIDSALSNIVVDWDEHIVDDFELEAETNI